MAKRIIITGASGFIGANLSRRLIAEGHDVYLILRPNCQTWRLSDVLGHVGTRFVQLQDVESLFITMNEIKPDWIFHLAAYGGYSWQSDWREIVEANMLGSINLFECAVKCRVEVLINTGCWTEYGFNAYSAPESQSLNPQSYYSISKAAQTMAARVIASKEELHLATLRLFSCYGPWQEPKEFIPKLIMGALSGELPPIEETRDSYDFVHIEDVVDAFMKAAVKPGKESGSVFNVGTGIQYTHKEVAEIAIKEYSLKKKPKFTMQSKLRTQSDSSKADITKIRKSLDWYPNIELDVGLKKFANWFRENPEFTEIYNDRSTETKTRK